MSKLIYKFKPFDYSEYFDPDTHPSALNRYYQHYYSFLLGVYNGINSNPEIKSLVNDYFAMSTSFSWQERNFVSFTGLGSVDSRSVLSFETAYSGQLSNIFWMHYSFNESDKISARGTAGRIPPNVVMNFAPLKSGGLIIWFGNFWDNYFYFLVSKTQNNERKTSFTTEFLIQLDNDFKTTIPTKDSSGFYNDRTVQTILPSQGEITMNDVSVDRLDYRGYNLAKGKDNTFMLYPYYNSTVTYLDLYYYDGGNSLIGNKELVYIGDRVFLCLSWNTNFLIELKVPEEDDN